MTKLTDVWTVRRRINIPKLRNNQDRLVVQHNLDKLSGVKKIDIDKDKSQIIITYDASQLNYQIINNVLTKANMPPLSNWWTRLKASWYQYTDTNARDNANAPPAACCNKPPHNI